jgi:hypothetical protein
MLSLSLAKAFSQLLSQQGLVIHVHPIILPSKNTLV